MQRIASHASIDPTELQVAPVLWFTGLSGAGKSTLAERLLLRLRQNHLRTEWLDGDEMRTHLSKGLGFSREDRTINVLRIAYVAHLLSRNGVIVLVSAISPYRDARAQARQLIRHFVEVHVATTLEECQRRDIKGLYRKAQAGEIPGFTGVDDPYEEPLEPEIRVDTNAVSPDESIRHIEGYLVLHSYI